MPIERKEHKLLNSKNKVTITKLLDQSILWGLSTDASYKYFFGRGSFCKKLTESKILILGLGAIGSIVAKTLARCGCKTIDLLDYDIKEAGNVCRSEYRFTLGTLHKMRELSHILYEISPFITINTGNTNVFNEYIKTIHNEGSSSLLLKQIMTYLNPYDIIFDCTTNDSLMYLLGTLKDLKSTRINLSVGNHCHNLVGGFDQQAHDFVKNAYENNVHNNTEDMYTPTGCWSPTFKASYNDIDLMVQMALKHINKVFAQDKPKNNFVISYEQDDCDTNLKLREY